MENLILYNFAVGSCLGGGIHLCDIILGGQKGWEKGKSQQDWQSVLHAVIKQYQRKLVVFWPRVQKTRKDI